VIPAAVRTWLTQQSHGEVVSSRNVGGGCINNGVSLTTSNGRSFFLKTNPSAPSDMFEREAEGLSALSVDGGPTVPQAYLWGADFLLLEDLTPRQKKPGYWEDFGRKLAVLHGQTNPRFGFEHNNYIGSTPQPNRYDEDGWTFFAEQRLLFQSDLAQRQGLLSMKDAGGVQRIATRLREMIPKQPASLIHGDLWSGNALTDAEGSPALIDPAVYFGWAEAELGMTGLFGAFPDSFYKSYTEAHPLEPGYRNRFPIYNLYHLLNHLNLFGASYLGQVRQVISRFA
jgi:protein-ribulosamine 3-kinase